jgi:SAM-dependent methyltransferase
MTHEASKTRAVRGKDFDRTYLSGRVIDIGCGPDLVVPHAEPFDLDQGDAQQIGMLRPNLAYDTVYSSHCLEHMKDVPAALSQWWALVKRGGFLVLVVPDEDLYEQGGWPSLFNPDHKATFRIGKDATWSPVSYDIAALVRNLDAAEIISCTRQDARYDRSLMKSRLSPVDRCLFQVQRLTKALFRRLGNAGAFLDGLSSKAFVSLGTPVDQTAGSALAQIQVVVRKRV